MIEFIRKYRPTKFFYKSNLNRIYFITLGVDGDDIFDVTKYMYLDNEKGRYVPKYKYKNIRISNMTADNNKRIIKRVCKLIPLNKLPTVYLF